MPLVAWQGDNALMAPLLSVPAWKALKGKLPRSALSCGADAVAKTSKLGTQFFAHLARVDDHEHKGESPEHLRVKSVVVVAATALGWEAQAEVRAPTGDWVADVLVEKNGRRIAFEVQLAGQTAEDYERRQARYACEGIECYWLVRKLDSIIHSGVPALQIHISDGVLRVSAWSLQAKWIGGSPVPLDTFLTNLLDGELRWAARQQGTQLRTVQWALHECYRCRELNTLHEIESGAVAKCARCDVEVSARAAAVQNTFPRRAQAVLGLDIQPAAFGSFTNPITKKPERGWSCWKCEAFLYRSHVDSSLVYPVSVASRGSIGNTPVRAHWCLPAHQLDSPVVVMRYLNGGAAPTPKMHDARTGEDLVAEARWRAKMRREARGASPKHSVTPSQSRLKAEPPVVAQPSALYATERQPDLDSPVPTPAGPAPSDSHERTAAIDAYSLVQVRHVDELLELFPVLGRECRCPRCREVWRAFNRPHRSIL